jgi:hypothetical protein
MEPTGITASILAIITAALKSAQFLANTINNVKGVPSTLKDISADLRAVESILQDLKRAAQDNPSRVNSIDHIWPAVENCDRVCKAFQLQVKHWMRHSKEGKIIWIDQWRIGLFEQESIKTFKGQLSECKSTLSFALSTAMFVHQKY